MITQTTDTDLASLPQPLLQRASSPAARMVTLLVLTQMLNYFDRSVASLAAPEMMKDLGLGPKDYGLIASAFFSLYAVSGIVVGLTLASRMRPRLLLIVLIGIWSLTQLPIAFSSTLMIILVCRAVLGVAESPSISLCVAAAYEWFPAEKRSLPTALVMAGPLIGSVIAPPLLTGIMSAFGWRSGFITCALFSAAVFAAMVLFGRDGPDSLSRVRSAGVPKSGAPMRIWLDRTVLAVTLTGLASYWMSAFVVTWMVPIMRLVLGFTQAEAGWTASAVFILCAFMLLASSALTQRLLGKGLTSRRAIVWQCIACLCACAAIFIALALLPPARENIVLLALGTALAFPVTGSIPLLVGEIAPPPHRNQMIVVIMSATTLAGIAAPYFTGLLIDGHPLTGYRDAMLLNAAVMASGALIALVGVHPAKAARRLSEL